MVNVLIRKGRDTRNMHACEQSCEDVVKKLAVSKPRGEAPREIKLADALISDVQLPPLWGNKFALFKPLGLGICYCSPSKPIYCITCIVFFFVFFFIFY